MISEKKPYRNNPFLLYSERGTNSKTFYKQSISPVWLDSFGVTTPHEDPPVTKGMRSAFHIEPFTGQALAKKSLDAILDTTKAQLILNTTTYA